MASAPSLWSSVSSDQMQLRMEADVRRLLRRAKNPFLLAACPLAQALCESTGIANALSALRYAIDGAFGSLPHEPRLRQLLLTSVDDDEQTRAALNRWQVSKRHFQRRRAKAVAILASHIRELIGGPQAVALRDEEGASRDPLETVAELIAGIEPSTASEILRADGSRCSVDACVRAMREHADTGRNFDGLQPPCTRHVTPALFAVFRAQAAEVGGDATTETIDLPDQAELRFELEWLNFLRARHRADAAQMQRVASNLNRLASRRAAWLSRAQLAQADAKIRLGLLDDAAALLDEIDRRSLRNVAIVEYAWSIALRSEIFLQRGNEACAERLASGAYAVLAGRHFQAWSCQATIARARLRLNGACSFQVPLGSASPSSPGRVALEVERARELLVRGDAATAARIAREAFERATARGYDGIAARAAAALGACCVEEAAEKLGWYRRALALLLKTRDRSIASDLFAFGAQAPCIDLSELIDPLYQSLITAIPHLRANDVGQRRSARRFLQRLTQIVAGETPTSVLDEAIHSVQYAAPSFAQYVVHFSGETQQIVQTFFQALAPPSSHAALERRIRGVIDRMAGLVQPSDALRKFLVG
jgi:tetratricopeptide (TPR) repeat protein